MLQNKDFILLKQNGTVLIYHVGRPWQKNCSYYKVCKCCMSN